MIPKFYIPKNDRVVGSTPVYIRGLPPFAYLTFSEKSADLELLVCTFPDTTVRRCKTKQKFWGVAYTLCEPAINYNLIIKPEIRNSNFADK